MIRAALVLLVFACTPPPERPRAPIDEKLAADVDTLEAIATALHPGLLRYHSEEEIRALFRSARERVGRAYDPAVVVQLVKHLAEKEGIYPEVVCEAALEELEPGMILGRDVVTGTGVPILAHDQALSMVHIRRLRELAGESPEVFVRRSGPEALAIVLEALAAVPTDGPAPRRARPGGLAPTRS